MNGLVKAAFRLSSCARAAVGAVLARSPAQRELTRAYWHVSAVRGGSCGLLRPHAHSTTCGCGCGLKAMHTKGERELVEFLTEEIVAERKAQKSPKLPTEVGGFKVTTEGAEIVLTKDSTDETIRITWNVNHTVDSDSDAELENEKQEFAEMRSKPQFEVDLVRGNTTLGFTCSFHENDGQGEEFNDVFGIDEITLYDGEWNDKVYCVAGDVLDGYLYDLLMNLLEEKGVSNEFAAKISDLSTAYEHSAYINLLEALSKFTIGK